MKGFFKKADWQKFGIILGAAAAVFSLFYIIWPIAFAVHDDLRAYLEVKCHTMVSSTDSMAREQGRFYFWFSALFTFFPYLFGSLKAVKFISWISLLFDGAAFYLFLKRLSGKWAGTAGFLLFFALGQLQDTYQHNLFVSYIFCHQIAVGIVLLGLERFLAYQEKKKKSILVISALLLLFSTLLYEAFLMFSGLFFLLSLLSNRKNGKWDIKGTFAELRWHILFMVMFLAAYLFWRWKYPSAYDGAVAGGVSPSEILRSLLTYATGYFPLRTAWGVWRSGGIRTTFSIVRLAASFVVAGGFILILVRGKRIINKGRLLLCGAAGTFLPVCLHALTKKYADWLDSGIYSYVPSFYSYFFLLCVLIAIGWMLYEKIPWKKFFLGVVFLGMTAACYITQTGNALQVEPYVQNLKRYEAFDRVVSSGNFAEIEEGAWIYVPDYVGIHGSMKSLSDYAETYTGKTYHFTKDITETEGQETAYRMDYHKETGEVFLTEMP